MVVKKKRTYKKQKGGEPTTTQHVDRIMIQFFDLIKEFIINNSVAINKDNIIKLCNYIDEKMKYSLFVKLSLYLNGIIDVIDTNNHDMYSLRLVKYLLVEPEMRDKFIDKFLKLYIHLLFIRYLFYKNNFIFKDKILTLLQQSNKKNNTIIASLLIMSNHLNSPTRLYIAQLEEKLRNLFLNDYSKEYGIPVFYGGLLFDSQYNEFVCRQVGASSNKKRNFIINPVLALAYDLFYKLITKNSEIRDILDNINRSPKINQYSEQPTNKIDLYEKFNSLIVELFKIDYVYIFSLIAFVIQNFNSKRENNSNHSRRDKYSYLYSNIHVPKLSHVSTDSQFCIVLDQFGAEEIIKYSRFSKCAWHYGCNLKMTPEIRDENISSMYDILRLAQILLLIVLTYGDNIFMDVPSVSEFLVSQYIELFYKKLDGQPINRNINSIKIKFNEFQIKTLVKILCEKYKDLLIKKLKMISLPQNTSIIDNKLTMIRDEISKYNGLNYLYKFLFEKKENICKNNSSNRINGIKLNKFRGELYKIGQLIR